MRNGNESNNRPDDFHDDTVSDIIERMSFALIEMGLRVRLKKMHDDYRVIELSFAEPLDKQNGKEKP